MAESRHRPTQGVVDHFEARAERYNLSSRWVSDAAMGAQVAEWLELQPAHRQLDVACGTGLWARNFHGRVGELVGLDLTPGMFEQAREHVDTLVQGSAEDMPFPDDSFDRVTERQGIQFMDAARAVEEMVRVAKPGGRVCLAQLCAYGQQDAAEYFEILALRNPARRNFFVREDLETLLRQAGCRDVVVHPWISDEDVGRWADNGAIADERQAAIARCYAEASPAFQDLHAVRTEAGQILDRMLFGVAIGVKG